MDVLRDQIMKECSLMDCGNLSGDASSDSCPSEDNLDKEDYKKLLPVIKTKHHITQQNRRKNVSQISNKSQAKRITCHRKKLKFQHSKKHTSN